MSDLYWLPPVVDGPTVLVILWWLARSFVMS